MNTFFETVVNKNIHNIHITRNNLKMQLTNQ